MTSGCASGHVSGVVLCVCIVWISTTIGYRVDQRVPNVCDYIIVGAGASGSTIAGRLSEIKEITVCLFEAGPSDTDIPLTPIIEKPRLWIKLLRSSLRWNYTLVPQKGLNGRAPDAAMGKVLGGSTSINAMLYFRGFEADYDYWASQGATEWSYAHVYSYFLKSENNISPLLKNTGFHRKGGPLTISQNLDVVTTPLYKLYVETMKELGIPLVDCNQPSPFGLCQLQQTIKGGKRQSTADAFLKPMIGSENLFIITNAFVEKVLIGHYSKRAYGIRYSRNGQVNFVKARREVIISAGALNSPQLLQLSGIGPRSLLRKLRIRSHADLPVGENYHDHYSVLTSINADVPSVTPEVLLDRNVLLEYIYNRTGRYAETTGVFALFTDLTKQDGLNWPEVESVFGDSSRTSRNGSTAAAYLLHPKSRGTVQIKSRNPYDPPLIDPKALQVDTDIKTLIAGLRMLRSLTRTSAMRTVNAELVIRLGGMPEECRGLLPTSDRQLECLIRRLLRMINHHTGTCKMGNKNDRSTVVDQKLRVKGIKGLRVADASIMPEIPSTNTMGPCIMIGEKAADMIKQHYLNKRNVFTN